MKLKTLIFLFAALACGAASAEQKDTIGVHLGTYHSSNIYCDNGKNPGLYLSDGDNGATIGFYHNSCGRQSYYMGWISDDWHGLSLMVMGVTGYILPVTPAVFPTFAAPITEDTTLRISGGSLFGYTVVHFSIERKF